MGGAVFSEDGKRRYRLDRDVQDDGLVFAFFGVNASTAGPKDEDQTTRKWNGFALRNTCKRYIVGNPFSYIATDVRDLRFVDDPVGPENDKYISEIIAEADIIVPCWGDRGKLPRILRPRLTDLKAKIFASGKPVLVFGLTNAGDPKHPLMLSYETQLMVWWP